MKLFRYASDTGAWYRTSTRKAVTQEVVERQLRKHAPNFKTSEIELIIESIKSIGVPASELFKKQEKDVDTANHFLFERAYQDVKSLLPIRLQNVEGTINLYTFNSLKEYKLWGAANEDFFLDVVRSMPELNAALRSAYNELDGDLLPIRKHFDYIAYLKKMYLCASMDSDFILNHPIKFISWDPDEPTYKRFNPDIIKPGPYPAWQEFLDRLSDPEIFMAYVWSIFEPKNEGRQALWLYGNGSDGKSVVVNTLMDYYGRDHCWAAAKGFESDPFFFSNVYNRRFGAIMETQNVKLISDTRIKTILGGDSQSINRKHQVAFTAKVYSRLIICSNKTPQIDPSQASELTRLLFVTVTRYQDMEGDPDWAISLREQIPHFLHACRELYPKLFGTKSNIKMPPKMYEMIDAYCVGSDSESIEEFIETFLEFGPDFSVPQKDLRRLHSTAIGSGVLRDEKYSYDSLKARLFDRKVVPYRPSLGDGKTGPRSFLGVRIAPNTSLEEPYKDLKK